MIERTCPICSKTYLVNPQRFKHGRQTTCSRECSYKLRSIERQNRVEVMCQRCGKPFRVTHSKLSRSPKFCSAKCKNPPTLKTCEHCGKEFRVPASKADQRFCSVRCVKASGVKSEQSRRAVLAMWADPVAKEERLKAIKRRSETPEWRSASHFQRGEKHPRYKGNRKARDNASRYEYKKWRSDVFHRDNFICQHCGQRGRKLNAHHIKPWSEYPELRYDVNNGITLCTECHDKAHGLHRRQKTYKCVVCGKRKTDGRQPRCRSCGAKTRGTM